MKRSLDSYRAHRPYVECVEEEGFPSPRRGNDEVARDALLPQSRPGLDLVLAPQVLEGRLGDVDASREREKIAEIRGMAAERKSNRWGFRNQTGRLMQRINIFQCCQGSTDRSDGGSECFSLNGVTDARRGKNRPIKEAIN